MQGKCNLCSGIIQLYNPLTNLRQNYRLLSMKTHPTKLKSFKVGNKDSDIAATQVEADLKAAQAWRERHGAKVLPPATDYDQMPQAKTRRGRDHP